MPLKAIFKVLGIIAAAIVLVIVILMFIGSCSHSKSFSQNDICILTDDTFLILDPADMRAINTAVHTDNVLEIMKYQKLNKILMLKKGTECKILMPDSEYSTVYVLTGDSISKTGIVYNQPLKKK